MHLNKSHLKLIVLSTTLAKVLQNLKISHSVIVFLSHIF